jgi:hypothetical protein
VRVMGARPGHADGVSGTEVRLRAVHGPADRQGDVWTDHGPAVRTVRGRSERAKGDRTAAALSTFLVCGVRTQRKVAKRSLPCHVGTQFRGPPLSLRGASMSVRRRPCSPGASVGHVAGLV